MVCIVATLLTKVYTTQFASIHCIFPTHILHGVPFASPCLFQSHVDTIMSCFIYRHNRTHISWSLSFILMRWEPSNQSKYNILAEVKVGISLFCWSCWSFLIQNVCIYNACIYKKPQEIFPWLLCKSANRILQSKLVMSVNSIHVFIVQVHIFRLIDLYHISTNSAACFQHISWVGICAKDPYCLVILPNSGNKVGISILITFMGTMHHPSRPAWQHLVSAFCLSKLSHMHMCFATASHSSKALM